MRAMVASGTDEGYCPLNSASVIALVVDTTRTRIGLALSTGIVAVDFTVIPLRSWVYVPDYGKGLAGDTGGGVKGKFVDLGFSEGEYQSWHWWSDVYLLWPPPPTYQIRWVLPDWPKYPDRRR